MFPRNPKYNFRVNFIKELIVSAIKVYPVLAKFVHIVTIAFVSGKNSSGKFLKILPINTLVLSAPNSAYTHNASSHYDIEKRYQSF